MTLVTYACHSVSMTWNPCWSSAVGKSENMEGQSIIQVMEQVLLLIQGGGGNSPLCPFPTVLVASQLSKAYESHHHTYTKSFHTVGPLEFYWSFDNIDLHLSWKNYDLQKKSMVSIILNLSLHDIHIEGKNCLNLFMAQK